MGWYDTPLWLRNVADSTSLIDHVGEQELGHDARDRRNDAGGRQRFGVDLGEPVKAPRRDERFAGVRGCLDMAHQHSHNTRTALFYKALAQCGHVA